MNHWKYLLTAVGRAILAWFALGVWAAGEAVGGQTGTVFAQAEIPLISSSGGRVARILVSEGASVRRGQLLLQLDSRQALGEVKLLESQIEHRAALRLEQANFRIAQDALKRDEGLFYDHNLSAKDLADSRDRLQLASLRVNAEEDRLDELRQQLALKRLALRDLEVRSPADGVLNSLALQSGQVVGPGARVGELLRLDTVLIETFVPLKAAVNWQVGRQAKIWAPAGKFRGRVKFLGEKLDPVTGTLKVKVQVENPRHWLKPGMMVQVSR